MIRFFDAGESQDKELVKNSRGSAIRKIFAIVTKGSFYMELLRKLNVKIVNRVIKNGKTADDSYINLSNDSIYEKPILIIKKSIRNVELFKKQALSIYKSFNVCVIPALGVVFKNALCLIMAKAFLQKISVDSVEDKINSYNYYMSRIVRR
jgi:chorismate synthase